ncbi:PREDICTED: fasciclin-like arabinogalactan protein 2 [Nelumbo nucifera]|uniref:Fasciclin-like arabinogalactan protein 2 n=1 Tax=Nelumbo nucifera TaxID=4432 RepID=A0A1U8BGL6_NELNU|nr:PREDICTED: fasciclin-like arabinogalactan protein 2 [Nelumbo nucifera]
MATCQTSYPNTSPLATSSAPDTSSFVNITNLKGSKVGFGAESNHGKVMASTEDKAPTPGPSQLNLTSLMSKQGCKVFTDMLVASEAEQTFDNNIEGGLTVFCPTNQVFKDFMPKYKNLTIDGKNLLLLYHGIPVYHSMEMLRSNNGVVNTLAIDGANKYDSTIQNNARVGKIGEDRDSQDNEDVHD